MKKPQKGTKKHYFGKKYICTTCDFYTSNKKDYRRHLETIKHSRKNSQNEWVTEKNPAAYLTKKWVTKKPQSICSGCNRKYKYKSGLCRHQKKCPQYLLSCKKGPDINEQSEATPTAVEIENVILRKELTELKDGVFEHLRETTSNLNNTITVFLEAQKKESEDRQQQIESFRDIVPMIGNTYNNKLSINVYLNEKCKDAMNLTDFMDKLEVSLDDLVYTKNHGFVKGISNIFVKQLKDMEPTQRPIHCSDKKRLQFYVKDEDKWGKDKTHQKLNNSIENVVMQQIRKIKEWEKNNPNYLNNDGLLMEWHSMVHNVMGGDNEIIITKNCHSIKKEIGISVEVKDELINK